MSTARTTSLGLRVLTGQERDQVIKHVAMSRAYFEREHQGQNMVACDREYVSRQVRQYLGENGVDVSAALVKQVQANVAAARKMIDEFDPAA